MQFAASGTRKVKLSEDIGVVRMVEDEPASVRARGWRFPDAVRNLARAWLGVIWRCWQDGTAYDPAEHGGHQRT